MASFNPTQVYPKALRIYFFRRSAPALRKMKTKGETKTV